MNLENLLKTTARRLGIPYETVLKDYAIGRVLSAISAEERLASTLVMKGGTALKKLYFGDYRFSEDLDFTGIGSPTGAQLETALHAIAARAAAHMSVSGQFSVSLERLLHRDPHPGRQENFVFRVQFPWQRQPLCSIKVEITVDEPVLLPALSREILHGYGENVRGAIRVYALEEIVAEKLRSILQSEARRAVRSWVRPRCRDYYDLWRILRTYGQVLDRGAVRRILAEKCAVRSVTFSSAEDFFPPGLVELVADAWKGDLGDVVAELPSIQTIISELEPAAHGLLEEDQTR